MIASHRMAAAVSLLALAGCASSPASIGTDYVNDEQYSMLACSEIDRELATRQTQLDRLTEEQRQAAHDDTVITGASLVLFWPAAVALAFTDDHKEEISLLKGELAALERVRIRKKCDTGDGQAM